MEVTTDQWIWIFNCISHRANDLGEEHQTKKALVSNDNDLFSDFAYDFRDHLDELIPLTDIQLSLLDKVDLGDRAALTREELLYNLKNFKESREKLNLAFKEVGLETDDSDGVLGDKAQD